MVSSRLVSEPVVTVPGAPTSEDYAAFPPAVGNRRVALGLVAAIVVGAALRLTYLGGKSIWLDEAFSIALASTSWPRFAHMIRTQEANMALYYFLLRGWLHLGRDEATVRLLSAVAGILTIPVVYALGSRLFDRRVGLVAASVLAIDPMQLWASQEARGYSLAVFLCTCSTWGFVHLVGGSPVEMRRVGSDRPARDAERVPLAFWWVLYTFASALGLYAHFYTGFVLLAQWLSLVARPRAGRGEGWWGPLLGSAAGVAVLLVPLALFFLRGPHGNIQWLGDAIRTGIPRTIRAVFTVGGFISIIGYWSMIIAVVIAGAFAVRAARGPSDRWGRLLALLWVATPIVIPLVVSILLKPVLDPRYLVVCIPGFALTAAALVAGPGAGPFVRPALIAILLLEEWVPTASISLGFTRKTGATQRETYLPMRERGTQPSFMRRMCDDRSTTTPNGRDGHKGPHRSSTPRRPTTLSEWTGPVCCSATPSIAPVPPHLAHGSS